MSRLDVAKFDEPSRRDMRASRAALPRSHDCNGWRRRRRRCWCCVLPRRQLRAIMDRQLEVSLDLEDLAQERRALPFERLREGRDAMVEAADDAHSVVELLERRTVAVEQCYPTVYGVGPEYTLVPEGRDAAEGPGDGDERGTGWTSEESGGEEERDGSDEDADRPRQIRMVREWRGTRRIGIRGERRRRGTWDLYL